MPLDVDWDSDGYPELTSSSHVVDPFLLRDTKEAWEWLKHNLETCAYNCCASVETVETTNVIGNPCQHIYFSTGGWSGAETLIHIIEGQFWASHLMLQWRKGGHYIFESPPNAPNREVK